MKVRSRLLLFTTSAAIVVVIVTTVTFFLQVHSATADWWPSAIPTRVQYEGRNFSCLDGGRKRPAEPADLNGLEERGHTVGGGMIYAPRGFMLPTRIVVAAGEELRHCTLSGGP